jgi:hypothetical protein
MKALYQGIVMAAMLGVLGTSSVRAEERSTADRSGEMSLASISFGCNLKPIAYHGWRCASKLIAVRLECSAPFAPLLVMTNFKIDGQPLWTMSEWNIKPVAPATSLPLSTTAVDIYFSDGTFDGWWCRDADYSVFDWSLMQPDTSDPWIFDGRPTSTTLDTCYWC